MTRPGHCLVFMLLLGLCSCSSSRNQMSGDPFAANAPPQAINAHGESADGIVVPVESAIHVETTRSQSTSPKNRVVDGNVVPASGFDGQPYCPEPGSAMGGGHSLLMPAGPMVLYPDNEASPVKYPDEYIYDGGDRDIPVHYSQFTMQGFDPEDAIAEYRDDLGVRNIKETTRVAVYSPRFAAVSVINTLEAGVRVDRAAGSEVAEFGVNFKSRTASVAQEQKTGGERLRTRLRASGLDNDAWVTAVDVTSSVDDHTTTLNVFEEYVFIRRGELVRNEKVALEKAVQAAAEWSHRDYPVVAARTTGPNEVYNKFFVEEITGLKVPDRKGRIRLVKLADKGVAEKGEVVTFTIRFDNIGDRPVDEVVIMDNLTTRMSYVPDSATSNQAGEFSTEDNGAGSLILRWELDEPLAGGEGGVVTFQARVE